MMFDVFAAAREAPAQPALITADRGWTYDDLAGVVRTMFAATADLAPGDRLAFAGDASLEALVAFYAAAAAGLIAVPIHPRLGALDRAELVTASRPARTLETAEVTEILADGATSGKSGPVPAPIDPPRILACLSSSGTTGRPKRVLLGRPAFAASAAASADNLGWRPDDRWLLCMPIAHVGGLSIVTRCLAARTCVVAIPRFEEEAVLEAIDRHHVTLLSVVPTMLDRLVAADARGVLARPRAVLVGGAAASADRVAEWRRCGIRVLTTYGLTEACSQVTCQAPLDAARVWVPRASGRPLAGIELSIVGDDGTPLTPGGEGRILVRGAVMMEGYDGEAPLAPGAWFDTGDVGMIGEGGQLEVLSRRVDRIVSGGENVHPGEVEHHLRRVPGVVDALVFGVDDRAWGQVVAAAIVARSEMFDEPAAAATLRRDLAAFKQPKLACLVDALPTTASGKPNRRDAARVLAARLRRWG